MQSNSLQLEEGTRERGHTIGLGGLGSRKSPLPLPVWSTGTVSARSHWAGQVQPHANPVLLSASARAGATFYWQAL